MAALLTTASVLQCPHGGKVNITSSNTKAKASAALALATDTFTVSNCPYQIPAPSGTVPHPCVRVQWTKTNVHTTVGGTPTLAQDSAGLCLAADQAPQGPVSVMQAEVKVSGT